MIKYAANAMLATRISFINDIANLCELVGADVNMVRKGIGSDPRIGGKFLYAGLGYGGSCFPKDVKALIHTAGEHGYRLELMEAVENVNRRQKEVLGGKVRRVFGDDLRGRTFALWGLAFKPETDDVRESAALVVVRQLTAAGAAVRVYDPAAMESARAAFSRATQGCSSASSASLAASSASSAVSSASASPHSSTSPSSSSRSSTSSAASSAAASPHSSASGSSASAAVPDGAVTYCNTMYEAVEGADALLLTTEWMEFRVPDWDAVRAAMKSAPGVATGDGEGGEGGGGGGGENREDTSGKPVVFDGRNIYDRREVTEKGFAYFGIGQPES
jgi:UDP-glucose 6-dehydrogenase